MPSVVTQLLLFNNRLFKDMLMAIDGSWCALRYKKWRMHGTGLHATPRLAIHSLPTNPMVHLLDGLPRLCWDHNLWHLIRAWIPELLEWLFPPLLLFYSHLQLWKYFNMKFLFLKLKCLQNYGTTVPLTSNLNHVRVTHVTLQHSNAYTWVHEHIHT